MSPDLEAAGREVVHAPVAEPTSLDGLQARVRLRRARRATATGALTLAIVVGVAAVAFAANRGDEKPRVAITPPGDLVCTRGTHNFGSDVEARSIWQVTDPAMGDATVGAARVWSKTGGNTIRNYIEHLSVVSAARSNAMFSVARACVDKPPLLAANDWPRTGVLVHTPADSETTLVVDTNGVVLGRAEIGARSLADQSSSLYLRIETDGHVEFLSPSIPPSGRVLVDAPSSCDKQRTLVREGNVEFPLLAEDEGSNGDAHVTRARGWLDHDTAVVEIASKTCRGGDMSFAGVFAVDVETHAPRVLMPEIDGSIASAVFSVIDPAPPTGPGSTTSTAASHPTPQTTPTTRDLAAPSVTVPNVVGLDTDAARAAINAVGLNVAIRLTANTTVAPGTAFVQSPVAGTKIGLPDQVVIVRVAFSPAEITLANARAKWAARRIAHYSFEYRQLCFCTPESTAKVRITVVNGEVVDVVAIDPNEVGHTDLFRDRSVEELFDLIAKNEASSTMKVVASYEPSSGVPVSIDVSCVDTNIADCGVTYEIGDIEFSD